VGPDTLKISAIGYDSQYLPVVVIPDSAIELDVGMTEAREFTELDCYARHSPGSTNPGHSTIKGRVTIESDSSIGSSIYVSLDRFRIDSVGSGYSCASYECEIDTGGKYSLHDVHPGCYSIYAGCGGCSYDYRMITVPPDVTRTIDFAISKKNATDSDTSSQKTTVTSRVWDAKLRAPLSGVKVTVFEQGGQSVTSDSEGVFVIKDLFPGHHYLKFSAPGVNTRVISVKVVGGINSIHETILGETPPKTRAVK
jgi:hypothetical protein